MSVLYKLHQDNRKNSANKGKWYGRAVITNTVDTDMLAEIIQRNCTAKRSDVVAVLTELVEVMQSELQASHRVKLNGFGSFKIGLRTLPSGTAPEFTVTKNVVGMRVNFSPELHISPDKSRTHTFLSGCKVQEAPKNDVITSATPTPTPTPQP